MKKLTYGLMILAAGVVSAAIYVFSFRTKTTEVAAPLPNLNSIAPARPDAPKIYFVPSLHNDAPPEFDTAVIDPTYHRDIQLAKGEKQISARPSELLHLHVRVMLENGWHTYMPTSSVQFFPVTTIKLNGTSVVEIAGKITASPPPVRDDEYSKIFSADVAVLSKTFIFDIPVRISPHAASGIHAPAIDITIKIDNDRVCKVPTRKLLPLELTVISDAAN